MSESSYGGVQTDSTPTTNGNSPWIISTVKNFTPSIVQSATNAVVGTAVRTISDLAPPIARDAASRISPQFAQDLVSPYLDKTPTSEIPAEVGPVELSPKEELQAAQIAIVSKYGKSVKNPPSDSLVLWVASGVTPQKVREVVKETAEVTATTFKNWTPNLVQNLTLPLVERYAPWQLIGRPAIEPPPETKMAEPSGEIREVEGERVEEMPERVSTGVIMTEELHPTVPLTAKEQMAEDRRVAEDRYITGAEEKETLRPEDVSRVVREMKADTETLARLNADETTIRSLFACLHAAEDAIGRCDTRLAEPANQQAALEAAVTQIHLAEGLIKSFMSRFTAAGLVEEGKKIRDESRADAGEGPTQPSLASVPTRAPPAIPTEPTISTAPEPAARPFAAEHPTTTVPEEAPPIPPRPHKPVVMEEEYAYPGPEAVDGATGLEFPPHLLTTPARPLGETPSPGGETGEDVWEEEPPHPHVTHRHRYNFIEGKEARREEEGGLIEHPTKFGETMAMGPGVIQQGVTEQPMPEIAGKFRPYTPPSRESEEMREEGGFITESLVEEEKRMREKGVGGVGEEEVEGGENVWGVVPGVGEGKGEEVEMRIRGGLKVGEGVPITPDMGDTSATGFIMSRCSEQNMPPITARVCSYEPPENEKREIQEEKWGQASEGEGTWARKGEGREIGEGVTVEKTETEKAKELVAGLVGMAEVAPEEPISGKGKEPMGEGGAWGVEAAPVGGVPEAPAPVLLKSPTPIPEATTDKDYLHHHWQAALAGKIHPIDPPQDVLELMSDTEKIPLPKHDMWAFKGYKEVVRHMKHTARLTTNHIEMLRERAQLHRDYANDLKSWGKSYVGWFDKSGQENIGGTKAAIQTLASEAEKWADLNLEAAKGVDKQVKNMVDWRAGRFHKHALKKGWSMDDRRKIKKRFSLAQTAREDLLRELSTAKTRYNAQKDIFKKANDSLEDARTRRTTNTDDLENLQRKVQLAERDLGRRKEEVRQAYEALEEHRPKYVHEMTEILKNCTALQMTYSATARTNLMDAVSAQCLVLGPPLDSIRANTRTAIQSITSWEPARDVTSLRTYFAFDPNLRNWPRYMTQEEAAEINKNPKKKRFLRQLSGLASPAEGPSTSGDVTGDVSAPAAVPRTMAEQTVTLQHTVELNGEVQSVEIPLSASVGYFSGRMKEFSADGVQSYALDRATVRFVPTGGFEGVNTDMTMVWTHFPSTKLAGSLITYVNEAPPQGVPTLAELQSDPGSKIMSVGEEREMTISAEEGEGGPFYKIGAPLTGEGLGSLLITFDPPTRGGRALVCVNLGLRLEDTAGPAA